MKNFKRNLIYSIIYNKLKVEKLYRFFYFKLNRIFITQAKKKITQTKIIPVYIIVSDISSWHYSKLYQKLSASEFLRPEIIITHKRSIISLNESDIIENFFIKENIDYRVWNNLGLTHKIFFYLNSKFTFYTNPWPWQLPISLQIYFNVNSINIYSPYQINIVYNYDQQYKNIFFRYLNINFVEHNFAYEQFEMTKLNSHTKTIISSHPAIELVSNINEVESNSLKYNGLFQILWTPHHTIHADGFSSFFVFMEYFKGLAERIESGVYVIFRPHPELFNRLIENGYGHIAKNYYEFWEKAPNGSFDGGNYMNSFISSDICVNDSESFLVLYSFTNKPQLITLKNVKSDFIPFIKNFVDKAVILNDVVTLSKNIEFLKFNASKMTNPFEKYYSLNSSEIIFNSIETFLKT